MVVIVCQENGNECDSDLMWGNPALEGLQQNREKKSKTKNDYSHILKHWRLLCV